MIQDFNIRKAKRSDLGAILALYAQKDMDNCNVLELHQAEQIMSRFELYPNYNLYVASIDNRIIGTFALLIMDNLAHLGSPSGIVEDVVVDEQLRSNGIGKQMVQFAIDVCKQYGCYKMSLSTNLNREKAHKFYENLGFKKHGFSYQIEIN